MTVGTERSLGSTLKWFVGKVENRGDGKDSPGKKDPRMAGRCQVRIYGKHDDEKNIPTEKLPWVIPLLGLGGPFGGPSMDGVGTSPVGLKKGSTVIGFYLDKDESIPCIFSVVPKAGEDGGQDGTDIKEDDNSLPRGAREKDKNDALPNNPAITEDEVAKKDQLHVDKPTIGAEPFDGTKVLDVIKKADPSNLSGSIANAVNGAKSILNTLSASSSLLSNFSSIASGGIPDLNKLLTLGAQAAGIAATAQSIAAAAKQVSNISSAIPSSPAAQVAQAVSLISSGQFQTPNPTDLIKQVKSNPAMALNIIQQAAGTANMIANAFNGSNPMATILGALGGAKGLMSLASQAQTLIGPITQSFGVAKAIAGVIEGLGASVFSGMKDIPIPKISDALNVVNNLNNIGNVAGINFGNVGNIADVLKNSPISTITNAVSQINSTLNPASLLNSAITLPTSITPANIATLVRNNSGVNVSVNTDIPPQINVPINLTNISNTRNTYVSATVVQGVNIVSATFDVTSLLNSSVNVNIPPALTINSIQSVLNNNPGVNYDVTGTVFKLL